jgi:hypothetical protein
MLHVPPIPSSIVVLSLTFDVEHFICHSSMALQPYVGPWSLLQFRNLFYPEGKTPWVSDQALRKASIYTQNNTNTE